MLTKLQKKLLKLLAINSRFSNKDLAKSLNVSPDTVEYQIKNLVERKQLCSLSTLFNYHALGYSDYHYLVRFKDISKIPIEELKQMPFVTYFNTCYGGYDLQLLFIAKTHEEANEYLEKVNLLFKDNVQDYFLVHLDHFYKYSNVLPDFDVPVSLPSNQKNIVYSLQNRNYADTKPKHLTLDDLDRKLIFELIKNPRESYLQLSKNFNVSRDTIKYRIERFIKHGFIRSFFIKPNYTKMGYFTNFLFVRFGSINEAKLKEYFVNENRIFYGGRTVGSYNCIFYVVAKTHAEFAEVLKEFRILFKDSILDLLLLHFEAVYKEVQFSKMI